MEELFKCWAKSSEDFNHFILKFNWWVIAQEINPDNCYSNDELLKKYNKYKT